ncbi:MAG: sugar kinase [Flavobacteriia bacterium]|nr:sugar kinase [Flavobacteriia bacterium]NBV91402.1 sugar kinase [Flavobacteriia bacterium]NBY41415.1 sugar kinase [Flavobacteriia bacterium]
MQLLTVGSVAFDAIETPFGHSDKIVGGAGTYISLAASFFNKNQALVSIVGEDFPTSMIQTLNDKGINTRGIQIPLGGKTFFWSGRYHNDMNSRDTLATELNVLGDFNPEVPEEFKNAPFLMLGNLSPEVQRKVIEQMTTRPKLIAMDTMNFWMDIAMDELKVTLKMVDLLIINDEEARQLTGQYALKTAAKKIFEMGPSAVIIKKGEHGALLFQGSQVFFAPALPLEEVFDPTGAGDSFAGGFMGYLSKIGDPSFENMKKAVIAGSTLASFCVEKFGTKRIEEITEEEIQQRMQSFVELSKFELI